MSNTNKKVFACIVLLAAVLFLIVYFVIDFSSREQYLHGGGFKETETFNNFEAGEISPKEKEVEKSEVEIKTNEGIKQKVPPPTN